MKTIDAALDVTAQILIRCTIIGVIVLFIWWGAVWLFGDLTYTIHSSIAPMTRDQFNVIHYTGLLTTKAVVSLLFLIPYIAIRLVMRRRIRHTGATM